MTSVDVDGLLDRVLLIHASSKEIYVVPSLTRGVSSQLPR